MSWKTFCSMLSPTCLKKEFGEAEYINIKNTCDMVNSTTLYNLYKGVDTDPMSYKEFYAKLKEHMYYDKYVCAHGTEFLYYVKFKEIKVTTYIPTDVVYIVPAIGGFQCTYMR